MTRKTKDREKAKDQEKPRDRDNVKAPEKAKDQEKASERESPSRREARERAGPGQGIGQFGNLEDPDIAGAIGPSDRIAEPDLPDPDSPARVASHPPGWKRSGDPGSASGGRKEAARSASGGARKEAGRESAGSAGTGKKRATSREDADGDRAP